MARVDWKETTATVYSCGVVTEMHGRSNIEDKNLIVFSYTVDGNYYSGEFTSSSEMKEGTTFPLKYDPTNPERNDRSEDPNSNLIANIGGIVIGIVIVILYEWWKSHR